MKKRLLSLCMAAALTVSMTAATGVGAVAAAYKGDVDNNGTINAIDATRILLYSVDKVTFTDEQIASADINSDDKINTIDASLVLLHVVGKKLIAGAPSQDSSTTTTTTSPDSSSDSSVPPQEPTTTTTTTTTRVHASSSFTPREDATIITLGKTIKVDGSGATVSGNSVVITDGGHYVLSGTLTDGYVEVNTTQEVEVDLYLNGVDITNSEGVALCLTHAKKIEIDIVDGSVNYLEDGEIYNTYFSNIVKGQTGTITGAALFSNDTVEIDGNGTLYAESPTYDGISSHDDLIINSGTYHITSREDALHANDDITVTGGNIYVRSKSGDGLDSNNSFNVTGGTLVLLGNTKQIAGSTDVEGVYRINGGTVIAAGGTKSDYPGNYSQQYSVRLAFTTPVPQDTLICIEKDGTPILVFSAVQETATLMFSSADITSGSSIKVYTGGSYSGGSQIGGIHTDGTYSGGTLRGTYSVSGSAKCAQITVE